LDLYTTHGIQLISYAGEEVYNDCYYILDISCVGKIIFVANYIMLL